MENFMEKFTVCIVLSVVVILVIMILNIIIKVMTIIELNAEKIAFDKIIEEEELEIQYKKNREVRDKEICEEFKKHRLTVEEELRMIRRNSERSTNRSTDIKVRSRIPSSDTCTGFKYNKL